MSCRRCGKTKRTQEKEKESDTKRYRVRERESKESTLRAQLAAHCGNVAQREQMSKKI